MYLCTNNHRFHFPLAELHSMGCFYYCVASSEPLNVFGEWVLSSLLCHRHLLWDQCHSDVQVFIGFIGAVWYDPYCSFLLSVLKLRCEPLLQPSGP